MTKNAQIIGQTVYTTSGEIAVVTRVHDCRYDGIQYYGQFCTGPLADSLNAAGQPNDFLLSIDAAELARHGI